jgi:hypothetical protein
MKRRTKNNSQVAILYLSNKRKLRLNNNTTTNFNNNQNRVERKKTFHPAKRKQILI